MTVDTKQQNGPSLLEGWNSAPNLITYSRIVLVVVFLVLDVLAGPWGMDRLPLRWAAAVLFIVAASTDKLDGWLARRTGQVTELGKLMDPIADKLLTCATLIVAAAYGELFGSIALGWVVVALFLLREIGITVMRFFVMERPGGTVIAAAWPGKLKTLFQCIGLAMLLLPVWTLAPGTVTPAWMDAYYFLTYAFIGVALVLCLYSGAVYLINTFGGRRATARP